MNSSNTSLPACSHTGQPCRRRLSAAPPPPGQHQRTSASGGCGPGSSRRHGGCRAARRRRCLARAVASTEERERSPRKRRGKEGRQVYKPASFTELLGDATEALLTAVEDGHTRLEVEFPALPSSVDSYKGASDMFIDANVQLAIASAKQMRKQAGKSVHIVVPDAGEFRRSSQLAKSALATAEGVTMGYLKENQKGLMGGLFGRGQGAPSGAPSGTAASQADVFMVVNASAVELLDVEKYAADTVGDRPLVLWNMEIDTSRGDLGLLGFPSRDLQHRFLCRFLPAFYIRQRDYSKSIAVRPYIVNYSGALFREYPGPWQVLLRQDDRSYACVAERPGRFTLGEAKEAMTAAMGLDTEEAGSAMAFLRRGYKRSTWWEDAVEKEQFDTWRR